MFSGVRKGKIMKKRVIALLMSGMMLFSLAGCSGGGEKSTGSKETTAKEESFKPTKDFNIRVPFAAGGSADTISRIVGQGLQKTYGKSVVVNNLTGANGAIAAADLLNAKSDATELMVGGISLFTLAPLFSKDINVNIDDFQFVSGLVSEDIMLYVAPEKSGIESWEDLKAKGEEKRIVFGSNAPGGTTHLLGTMLFGEANIEAEALTSEGSAKDLLALSGGNVDCALATASLGAQYVEEGSMVPIVVFSEEPYTGYEGIEVPTAQSLGYDIVFKACNFLMTKKDVKKQEVDAIHQAIVSYSETDEFKELAKSANYEPSLEDGEVVKKTIEDAAEMCKEAYETYYKK